MIKAEKELGKDNSDYIALEKQYKINSLEKKLMLTLKNLDTISLVFPVIMTTSLLLV